MSASCTFRQTPPMTTPSSLQSNWKASPHAKLSDTKAERAATAPCAARHARMHSVTRA
jgi:hypothetical protein